MRNRYTILHLMFGWAVVDNHDDKKPVESFATRREARDACNRLNASEDAADRDDRDQSAEETI